MSSKILFSLAFVCVLFNPIFSQTDTIQIKQTFFGPVYKMNGKTKTIGYINRQLKQTKEADLYRIEARKYNIISLPFSIVGGALFYPGFKQVIYGYNTGWAYLGGAAIFITGGILIGNKSKKNLKKAILIHNKKIKKENSFGQELKIGISPYGIGLVCNF